MNCPNCKADCSGQSNICDFCGHELAEIAREADRVVDASVPPPLPNLVPISNPSGLESDNPYAASDSSSYGQPQALAASIPNHMALSITATILTLCFCCIPFGLVPLIFSAQVNSKLADGNYAGAQSDANNAKLWSWISIGVALAIFLFSLLVNLGTLFAEMLG
jgi:hypothetical protein